MYQYFKRQLETPTCFGPSGIHPQGVLKVLHWNCLWYFCVRSWCLAAWNLDLWCVCVCVCVSGATSCSIEQSPSRDGNNFPRQSRHFPTFYENWRFITIFI